MRQSYNNFRAIFNNLSIRYPQVERTTRDVYGKEVIRVDKDIKVHKDEIENWYITLPFNPKYDMYTYLDIIRDQIERFELNKCKEVDENFDNITQYCLVTDWEILEEEIVDKITLVKYAKVLKNL